MCAGPAHVTVSKGKHCLTCMYRVGDRPQASSQLSQQEEVVCGGASGAGVGPTL